MHVKSTLIALPLLALSASASHAAMSVADGFEPGSRVVATGSGALSMLPGQARTGQGYGLFQPFLKPGTLSVTAPLGRKRGSTCSATVWVRPLGGGELTFAATAGGRPLAGMTIPVLVSGPDVANNFYQPYTITFPAKGRPVTVGLSYDPQGLAASLRVDDLGIACR